MSQTKPTMKTVSQDEAQQQLSQLIKQVAQSKTRTRIEENGKPVAGLISAEELELLSRFGGILERFQPLLASWAVFEDESPEKIEREVNQALTSVRRKYPVSRTV